ncbi:Hypothetical_protein [Hexamita inflata]|uniref:Hypothetical_protein n=1 Tax=Hexamita inflata TaxID=28002 RepID=A0AA86NTI8_9EUKA|nr:Hypothetical protein HINF_LOCUS12846 [Hexamita inflata]
MSYNYKSDCLSQCTKGYCESTYFYQQVMYNCVANDYNIYNTYDSCNNNCYDGYCSSSYNSMHSRTEYECIENSESHSALYAIIFLCIPVFVIIQLWEVELLFLVYYVSNYILKYFATSNADDKFQQIISSWRLFMNYSLTQEGQKYDFDRIRPQSTIQSRYLIFQKGKIEITTCNKRTAMTKINAVEDVQGRSTNSLNKLRQF